MTTSVSAANTTSRFRPRTSSDYATMAEQQATDAYLGVRRSWGRRTRPSTTSTTTSTASTTGTVRTFSDRRYTYSNTGSRSVTTTLQPTYDRFETKDVHFSVELPDGFIVLSDTLNLMSGSYALRNGDTYLTVSATDKRCDGTANAARYCLQAYVDARREEAQKQAYRPELLTNEEVTLHTAQNRVEVLKEFDKQNTGWLWIFRSGRQLTGELTFFEPTNEYIWTIRITAPDGEGQLLNDTRKMNQLMNTLFSEKSTAPSRQVTTNIIADQTQYTQNLYRYDQSIVNRYEAENIGFVVDLPKAFRKITDTLQLDSGQMLFESDTESVEIRAMSDICYSQTRSIMRKCIEMQSAIYAENLEESFGGSVLKDENILMQLSKTDSSKEDIGRMILRRNAGERQAIIVFSEPKEHHVWVVHITSPEVNSAVLVDSTLLQKLKSSFLFE